MRDLLHEGRLLLLDLASTVFFLVAFLMTRNLPVAVASGIALGFAQIAWQVAQNKPIDVMQWMSLIAVMGSGAATLISHDPKFMMVKPSVIYIVVGTVMLKPGWMNRYLPLTAQGMMSDIVVAFGFAWAGLMFISAAVNLFVALTYSVVAWSAFMTIYGIISKAGLTIVQYATMRCLARLRSAPVRYIGALPSASAAPH